MKFAKVVLGLLLLLPCSAVYAQDNETGDIRSFWTGNNLFEWCSKADGDTAQQKINASTCTMYIVGVSKFEPYDVPVTKAAIHERCRVHRH